MKKQEKVKRPWLNEEKFRNVKLLQGVNLSMSAVRKVTAHGPGTIKRIFGSETFDEYQRKTREMNARRAAAKLPAVNETPSIPDSSLNSSEPKPTDLLVNGEVLILLNRILENQQDLRQRIEYLQAAILPDQTEEAEAERPARRGIFF